MKSASRAVFDCNTLLQALSSPEGPAGRCFELVLDGRIALFISPMVLGELREVAARPRVIAKLHLVSERTRDFFETIQVAATVLDGFPEVFSYQRDPDDAHYVNLAVAASASLIVSRDKDLLDLMNLTKPEAAEFHLRFPSLRILSPVEFLREFDEGM